MTVCLTLAALLVLPAHVSADDRYDWPLDLAPALTSTYAEYRSGRFHAGLDIKTWGKEGIPCVAVADGYVWRVRTSPWGYGRALYVRLADGRTAVYAHLSRFSSPIERVVAAEQDRRGAYSVNVYLQADRLPVKRGQVIAFSGSTGSGYPHLHFEIRDGQYGEEPLNPLTNGFGVADTISPTPVSVAFIPMDVSTRIGSGADTRVLPVRWDEGSGRFLTQRLSLWGRFGLAINIFDRADASALTNRLAPYRIRLVAGGRELFRTTYSAFTYAQIRRVDLDRNFYLTRSGRKGFHNLYLLPGNNLGIYGGDHPDMEPGAGILSAGTVGRGLDTALNEGDHDLAVVAEDANGNSSIVHIPIVVERRSPTPVFADSGAADSRFPLSLRPIHYARHVVMSVETSKSMTGPPRVGLRESSTQPRAVLVDDHTAHIPIDLAWGSSLTLDVTASLSDGSEASGRFALSPTAIGRDGGEVASDDGIARTIVPPSSVYAPFFAQVRVDSTVIADSAGVVPVSRAYRFEPATIPFREMVQIHFRIPEATPAPEKLGVYEWTDQGWTFVWNDVDHERGTVWAGVWHFSTYAVVRDDEPPVLARLVPGEGERVEPVPEISVALHDSLSGIPMEELIAMTMDGQTLIFEYDPEGEIAKGILRAPLIAGPHEWTVRVRDVCGNESSETRRFIVGGE